MPKARIAIEYHGNATPGMEGENGKKHKSERRREQNEPKYSNIVSSAPRPVIARPVFSSPLR